MAAGRGLTGRNVVRPAPRSAVRLARLAVRVREADVDVTGRRLVVRLPVDVVNHEATAVTVRGCDQVLVTYDERRGSPPERATALDQRWTIRSGRKRQVRLTFVIRRGEAPEELILRYRRAIVRVSLYVR